VTKRLFLIEWNNKTTPMCFLIKLKPTHAFSCDKSKIYTQVIQIAALPFATKPHYYLVLFFISVVLNYPIIFIFGMHPTAFVRRSTKWRRGWGHRMREEIKTICLDVFTFQLSLLYMCIYREWTENKNGYFA
jgi:hypothetical protein